MTKVIPTQSLLTIAFALAMTVSVPPRANAANQNPTILPPNSAPQGKTYGEWSALWLKWAFEPPQATNPLFGSGPVNCAQGQSGRVWFLAGTSAPGNAVYRMCSIPAGISLFFPVGNAFCAGDDFPNGFADERACATSLAPDRNYLVEIDGLRVNGLEGGLFETLYRAFSPPFDLVLGSDNLFNAPAGTYSPAAGDGAYLFLAPLTPGMHTIHIHAEFATGGQIDVTYQLTVQP